MGVEALKCCGALIHVYGDAGNYKHKPEYKKGIKTMTNIDTMVLPGWLAEHLPRETTDTHDEQYINSLSRCPYNPYPHNAHRYGEGMQVDCVGIPGTIPATDPLLVQASLDRLYTQLAVETERLNSAQNRVRRLDREIYEAEMILHTVKQVRSTE
jgi:hypothetical protein